MQFLSYLCFLINLKKVFLLFLSNKTKNIALNDIKLKLPNEYSHVFKEKGWCFIEDFLITHLTDQYSLANKNNFKLNSKVIKNFSMASYQ